LASWLRELMPSVVNTFRKWWATVAELMYRCAAISAFEAPWLAKRAICVSRAVRASRVCAVRSGALARRPQFYPCPFGKRPGTG
jgi:hypothetical protein